jgi:hypothetical protein
MQISQGPHLIDDTLTFTVVTHRFDTGALTDADAVPAYRVYEDETGTAILTGNMAKLDDTNTTGFYSEQITLSAANGFEEGKSYSIYVSAAVNSVTGAATGSFKVTALSVLGIVARGTAQAATGTTLQLAAASAFADDELNGATVLITGGSAGVGQRAIITDYVSSTDTATVATWTTTPTGTITYVIFASPPAEGVAQTGDAYAIVNHGTYGNSAINTNIGTLLTRIPSALFAGITSFASWLGTLAGKTADTSTRAEINATTAGATFNETTDSLEAVRDRGDAAWITATTLDAAGVRSAVGLASANLDTQLDALPTAAENASAVLSAATSNPIDANVQEINDVALTGDGSGTPFDVA